MSRDYERLIETAEMLLYACMTRVTLKRLAQRAQENCSTGSNALDGSYQQTRVMRLTVLQSYRRTRNKPDRADGQTGHTGLRGGEMGQIITVASGKGGCAKTSLAMILSATLVSDGYRVAVIDADPNACYF
jgi:Mrp family chromosome partitioning ATPase